MPAPIRMTNKHPSCGLSRACAIAFERSAEQVPLSSQVSILRAGKERAREPILSGCVPVALTMIESSGK